MRTVTIDGAYIKSISDFHKSTKRLFNFPEYYGENLDALWDCLVEVETPITIIWKNHKLSASHLSSDFTKIVSVFNDAQKEIEGIFVEYK
ncbi:ribonuclease inhibitor [Mucilaginibacter sp. UYP25]|uniref:barstar family protein n=1 Tax=unclassified Mucilaginibacter TaxID=2617802 RepID=UPI003394CB6B